MLPGRLERSGWSPPPPAPTRQVDVTITLAKGSTICCLKDLNAHSSHLVRGHGPRPTCNDGAVWITGDGSGGSSAARLQTALSTLAPRPAGFTKPSGPTLTARRRAQSRDTTSAWCAWSMQLMTRRAQSLNPIKGYEPPPLAVCWLAVILLSTIYLSESSLRRKTLRVTIAVAAPGSLLSARDSKCVSSSTRSSLPSSLKWNHLNVT